MKFQVGRRILNYDEETSTLSSLTQDNTKNNDFSWISSMYDNVDETDMFPNLSFTPDNLWTYTSNGRYLNATGTADMTEEQFNRIKESLNNIHKDTFNTISEISDYLRTGDIISKNDSDIEESVQRIKRLKPETFSDKHSRKSRLKEAYRKKNNKFKFKVGELYTIRNINIQGIKSEKSRRVFLLKQVVWCIGETDVCGLVVKQVDGESNAQSFLSKSDCSNLHVRYEPKLQLKSMFLNWMPVNYSDPKGSVLLA